MSSDPEPTRPFTPNMNVQPGPVLSACKKLPDGQHVLIHFEHTTGATSLVVDNDFAKGLIAQLQEVTGGIVVPVQTS